MKLVTAAEMQAAERDCGAPVAQLMENAGLAFAREVKRELGDVTGKQVLVLAGPGNNGGDGLAAARHLREWGAHLQVYLLQPREAADEGFRRVQDAAIPVANAEEDCFLSFQLLERYLAEADVVIDALLGAGVSRPIAGNLRDILARLRGARGRGKGPRLFAVDLPSGVNPDTGAADGAAVAADATIAFQWAKVGLHMLPASLYTGRLIVTDIGIPAEIGERLQTELMTDNWASNALPLRPLDAHKGAFGKVLVVAGSPRYVGAAHLATLAALRIGAGLATLACGSSVYPLLASRLVEPTFFPLSDEEGQLTAHSADELAAVLDSSVDCVLLGPGLGQGEYLRAFVSSLLQLVSERHLRAMVIDADGLNNLSRMADWPRRLTAPTILTPHPGELSRLSGLSIDEIDASRLSAARQLAQEWNSVLVLKGAHTIVAAPDGRAMLSPFANPALATGGAGDVLAGAIAGLAAQGLDNFASAALGVYLHGLAAENVRARLGDAGLLAGDLLPELPLAMRSLREQEGAI